MNWKNEAIERLSQYTAARCAESNLHSEVERLESVLRSPGVSRTDTPAGSPKSREDWQLNQMLLLEQTRSRLHQTRQWLRSTEEAMNTLTEEERLVLQRLFISPKKGGVEALCRELAAERSSVYRRRDQALRRFTLALYGPS